MELIKDKVPRFTQLYHQWRALRNVPFRKKFFIGYDLDGNTYWEFFNPNNPLRPRRIVDYRETRKNWVDYKMPPQWMQWLRFARPTYPTLEELAADKQRQELLKYRVMEAEQRWQSVPLKNDQSAQTSSLEMLLKNHKQQEQEQPPQISLDDLQQEASKSHQQQEPIQETTKEPTPSPLVKADEKLKQQQSNPSDVFKPTGWTPVSRR
ncbi:uncharacterized protein SAPINGB_P005228 [Magnusiomyces paraingens]|uniref:NADH dehydrogenase [ubiquinone] 1 alpha subcomplex subunit n=1 Tax=Magnusiomyces paraingens TaxID=2606893 RepID=A0A5E8C017_9ASCO|nr:uncharacterized protein SAPINGB_P005228 [Saprochaete ingens]VVT56712.1 unnamed protein product [Saprochaete ingens]